MKKNTLFILLLCVCAALPSCKKEKAKTIKVTQKEIETDLIVETKYAKEAAEMTVKEAAELA